jgi:hypothetical protein
VGVNPLGETATDTRSVQGSPYKKWARMAPATPEEIRLARGRRRYNAVRKQQAEIRRVEVERLVYEFGWKHGMQARIARHLGVSEATVSRDMKAIFPKAATCPTCETRVPRERWSALAAGVGR